MTRTNTFTLRSYKETDFLGRNRKKIIIEIPYKILQIEIIMHGNSTKFSEIK